MRSLVVAVVDGQNSHEFCYAECTNLTGAGSMLGSMGYMSPVLPENQHMLRNIFSRPSLAMFLVVYSLATRSVADEPLPAAEVKPQRQRMLTGDDAKRAAELQQRIAAAEQADKYDEVIALDEKLLALRTARQGADHWETVDQKGAFAAAAKAAARPAGERANLRNAVQSHREALRLHEMGRYAEAQPLFQKALDLSRKLLGENDRDTARGYCNVALGLSHQGKYAEAERLYWKALGLCLELFGEKHPKTAHVYNQLALNFAHQGKYAEAEPLQQKALELYLELFGEKHSNTARVYHCLATNFKNQGKYAEAEPLFQKTLRLYIELLGEKHPVTAPLYHDLATNFENQGKYAEAEPLHRKALGLYIELFGEKHHRTAQVYNCLATNFANQGKFAEAKPLYQKVLGLYVELSGEEHPDIANAYNTLALDLALNLARGYVALGKHAEAEPLFQKALGMHLERFGEKHPETAHVYIYLATNFANQEKYAEAEPLQQKALRLCIDLHGEKHPATAYVYKDLALNFENQGNYAEAEPLQQKALGLCIELYGEKHPKTADGYNYLATNLANQGKYAEAEPLYQNALDLRRELLGEKHHETVHSYLNLARVLNYQGKHAEAQPLLVQAAASYEAARLNIASRGLERASYGANGSPYRLLVATLARLNHLAEAWAAAESDLSRGSSDEVASRRGASVITEERDQRAATVAELSKIQSLILQLVSTTPPTDEQKRELTALQEDRRRLESKLSELAVALSQREIAKRDQVQAAIPQDAALVLWVDPGSVREAWGCVLRSTIDPQWEPLPGAGGVSSTAQTAGREAKWTPADAALAQKLTAAVASGAPETDIARLAKEVYAQRIAPLEKHLDGVKRLFVVPVGAMAGVPVDVLTDKFTISYVPSGTFLARLKDRAPTTTSALLALGDPVFPPVKPPKEPPLPPGGLMVAQVTPGGNADQAHLRPGDVLLKYAGVELTAVEQLGKLVEQHGQAKSIAIAAWRDGQAAERKLAPGALGAVLDRQPAREGILARREADRMLLSLARGGEWAELPGSAIEVARLAAIAGGERSTILMRSAASDQALEALRASDKLAQFRYLHFATHGEPNHARSFESALILAQDQISTDLPLGGGKYYDGRLTANEVLENWKLDAELVTLSACESALGRPGGGDGALGFAQAFLLAGSRAVCLSLWKVDDTATALLMDRFYENLLGKRAGLAGPMAKAEALGEAKCWLRDLDFDEATKLSAAISSGVARGKGAPALKLAVPSAGAPSTASAPIHRFSHPRYWAAFVLIGDPN